MQAVLFLCLAASAAAAPDGCKQLGNYVKELSADKCSLDSDCMKGVCKVNLLPQCTYTSTTGSDKRGGPCIEFGGSFEMDLCAGEITLSVSIPATFWTLGCCGAGWTGSEQPSATTCSNGYGTCTYTKKIESGKEVSIPVPELYVGSSTFNLKAQVYLKGKLSVNAAEASLDELAFDVGFKNGDTSTTFGAEMCTTWDKYITDNSLDASYKFGTNCPAPIPILEKVTAKLSGTGDQCSVQSLTSTGPAWDEASKTGQGLSGGAVAGIVLAIMAVGAVAGFAIHRQRTSQAPEHEKDLMIQLAEDGHDNL